MKSSWLILVDWILLSFGKVNYIFIAIVNKSAYSLYAT